MFRYNWKWLGLVFALLLSACAYGGRADQLVSEESYYAGESAPVAPSSRDVSVTTVEGEGLTSDGVANQVMDQQQVAGDVERLIIRTGQLSIVVANTEETMAAITSLVNGNEGWIVSSNVYQYSYQSDEAAAGDMTVRVPAGQFEELMNQIKDLALEVSQESSSGQDVTEEYVDLTARLANLEATAERVRAFLDESQNVEEALAVNVELSRLEGEIESYKGRIQYLSQSAAFSTITIAITPDVLSQPIQVAGWQPQGVARDAIESLIEAFQWLASVLIWLVLYLLPLLLVVGLPLWLLVRWVRRRRSGRA